MEELRENPWLYRMIIVFALLLILIDVYNIWACLNTPCCEFHYWFINKDAVCSGMFGMTGGNGTWFV